MRQVTHKQVYRPGPFGGEINTTLCGRMANAQWDKVVESNCRYDKMKRAIAAWQQAALTREEEHP